ncbi:penicillin-binding protein 1C [Paracoccus pacificus]|uniref:peptidoglycan glycosyltransferase n=1 Tax=Paracoccus pacificus TaxID=1463598 RepID=A0ABW4R8J1_9RHOB
MALLVALLGVLLAWTADDFRARLDRWIATTDLPLFIVPTGTQVVARDGSLLRAFQVADGRWRLDVELSDVDPLFINMLTMWEDRRFYSHHGVDNRAILRAAWQLVTRGRIVSGASTLTMQTARLLEEGTTGRLDGKLRQMRVALAMERQLRKDQILGLYLRLAPYGSNVEGVRAASLLWFGKEPKRLSAAQAALLVALPQAPEGRRPDRFPEAARAARNRVLQRAAAAGIISAETAASAAAEPVPAMRRAFPALAPLLADRLRRENPGTVRIATTIDPRLQRMAEKLARQATRKQTETVSAAMILADYRTGEILADVGAAEWANTPSAGFVDMTRAIRSPGSTLKPFVYGLAFDDGLAHPETLVEDRPATFGRWAPLNFDRRFRGTISIRQSLIQSLNIPVVRLAEVIGPARIVQAITRGGGELIVIGDQPGLAITLGGAGISLESLVTAYGSLARGGRGLKLSALPGGATELRQRMFGRVAAWQVTQILSQLAPPTGQRPGRIAYKTGTSYGNRDALAVGFDGRYVAGVWLGRPDGTPIPGAFGGELAAPFLFDLFDAISANTVPLPPPPPATLIVSNSQLPLPLRRFSPPGEVSAQAASPVRARTDALQLTFPPEGAQIELGRDGGLLAKAQGGTAPYTWLVNGAATVVASPGTQALLTASPGFARVTVIDSTGASASASVKLD